MEPNLFWRKREVNHLFIRIPRAILGTETLTDHWWDSVILESRGVLSPLLLQLSGACLQIHSPPPASLSLRFNHLQVSIFLSSLPRFVVIIIGRCKTRVRYFMNSRDCSALFKSLYQFKPLICFSLIRPWMI